jgi:outer membrane protein OmpA-like peptidoglycan-associated protein
MTRMFLLVAMALTTIACSSVGFSRPPGAEITGRWTGTWRAMDTMNLAREGRLDVDFTQDGQRGRGRMVWADTQVTDVPQSARLAGAIGVPVVFVVTGSRILVRHELGARQLSVQLAVSGDDMIGLIHSPARVEIRLTRQSGTPGWISTRERVGRLENDLARARERLTGMESRMASLGTSVEGVRTAAEEAATTARQAAVAANEWKANAGDATSRVEDLERRLREGAVTEDGTVVSNGHGPRAVVHTLDVRFAFNRADLDTSGQTALVDIADLLKENPELTAELEGYTDNVGSADYNLRLSQRRVDAVYRYLARRGVALDRLHIIGLGKLPEAAPEAQAKNRRVTIKLLMDE